MTSRTERIVWIVTAVCLLLAGLLAHATMPVRGAARDRASLLPPPLRSFDGQTLEADAARAVAHDPFRLDRRPTDIAFGVATPAFSPSEPAAALATPSLSGINLKGVIGGPPWQAVLGGVPGRESDIVVRAGDTLTGFRVERISPQAVVLAAPDSSITLTPSQAWP